MTLKLWVFSILLMVVFFLLSYIHFTVKKIIINIHNGNDQVYAFGQNMFTPNINHQVNLNGDIY